MGLAKIMRQYKYIVTGEDAFGNIRTMGYTNSPKTAHKWADEVQASEPGLIGNVIATSINVINECYNTSLYKIMKMLSDHEVESLLNNLEVRL